MKHLPLLIIFFAVFAVSCKHESIDDRVEREAREYTEKNCPTPNVNNTRVDSLVYDRPNRTLTNYCSVTDQLDNQISMNAYKKDIIEGIAVAVRNDPTTKTYRDAGISIRYVLRSSANPQQVWIDTTVK